MVKFSDYFAYDESAKYLLVNLADRGSKAKAGLPTHGSKSSHGYYVTGVNKKNYPLHRIIWELHHGPIPKGFEIDHKNMDRSDNRICNLRLASRSENSCNRRGCKTKRNKDLPKGIYKNELWKGSYQAKIQANGKSYSKSSTNIDELVDWINKKRLELHGEFGRYK